MGLDMYLYGKKYLSKYSDPIRAQKIKKMFEVTSGEETLDGVDVSITLGYWRKANAIHRWFVENVQDGKDDGREYYVSKRQLRELLETVETVLKNKEKAKELLPTERGFFFGSTDHDIWYFKKLEYTKKLITRILNDKNLKDFTFYYQSSW